MATILIIEDDIMFCQILERFLVKNSFVVTTCHTVKSGTSLLQTNTYDVALIDYRLPDGLGMEILTLLHTLHTTTAPIIMTSFHDVRTAVKTIRSGAYDYITKPVNQEELLLVIQEALGKKSTAAPAQIAPSTQFVEGISDASQQLQEYIKLVAPTDFSVIIQGESGTGKELAAKSIHNHSKRSRAPFVALDCGALSADLAGSELFGHVKGAFTGAVQNKTGQFEEAEGGTIFLDEIGNLSYEVQVKLLRAIQERVIQPVGSTRNIKIDVRIIVATNDNLQTAVKTGKFREDLFHRLNEFSIHIPSLHERKEDMLLFTSYFINQTNAELGKQVMGLDDEVSALFMNYDWPGNLRELRNIIKRAVLLTTGDRILMTALPPEMKLSAKKPPVPTDTGLKASQAENEKELILKTLEQVKYNKTKAAKLLNIDRTTLYYKMSKYNIE